MVRLLDAMIQMPDRRRKLVVGRTGRGCAGEARRRGARGTARDEAGVAELVDGVRAREDMPCGRQSLQVVVLCLDF